MARCPVSDRQCASESNVMPEFAVILPAAGSSRRFRGFDQKKPFVSLDGEPIWQRTVRAFHGHEQVSQVLLVLADADRALFHDRFARQLDGIELVSGGPSRAQSVCHGLEALRESIEFVAVHDAARPLIKRDVIDTVFTAAVRTGAAIPAVPITSTVKRVDDTGQIDATIDRSNLRLAQTPQTFERQVLVRAFEQARGHLQDFTDEASLVEAIGHPVTLTAGSWDNMKITTAEDLQLAEMILSRRAGRW